MGLVPCMKERIEQWFSENKGRFALLLGILLVGILCFEAGLLQGKMKQEAPLIITLPEAPAPVSPVTGLQPGVVPVSDPIGEPVVAVQTANPCLFVGSKNSDKYHLATCAVAKRIKGENKLCFGSKEEAERRGYIPSCLK
jgi:hypothetical protein